MAGFLAAGSIETIDEMVFTTLAVDFFQSFLRGETDGPGARRFAGSQVLKNQMERGGWSEVGLDEGSRGKRAKGNWDAGHYFWHG
jgi:hypothetical protein